MSEKIYEGLEQETVTIFMNGVGLIIGKFSKTNYGVPRLKRPRIIQIKQIETGSVIQMVELFGKPDEIALTNKPVFIGKVKDQDVLRVYVQNTTGLVMANKIPEVIK